MGRCARIRAAIQMERDGIRSMNRHEIGKDPRCCHTEAAYEGLILGCKNRARYLVQGVGKRCFAHASGFIGRGVEQAPARTPTTTEAEV